MQIDIGTTISWLTRMGAALCAAVLLALTGSSTLTTTTSEWSFVVSYVIGATEHFLRGSRPNGWLRLRST